MLKLEKYDRVTTGLVCEQVTLENVKELAKWCGGTVEMKPTRMLGTSVDLPVIKLRGQGQNRGKFFEAPLGFWIVELKGSFRCYNPNQFASGFRKSPVVEDPDVVAHDPSLTTDESVPTDAELLALAEEAVTASTGHEVSPATYALEASTARMSAGLEIVNMPNIQ
jgi:hypothetical protein